MGLYDAGADHCAGGDSTWLQSSEKMGGVEMGPKLLKTWTIFVLTPETLVKNSKEAKPEHQASLLR